MILKTQKIILFAWGDSGSPVGRFTNLGFELLGMHLGLAADTSHLYDQDVTCDNRDGYSRYVPYDTIAEDIGITDVLAPATVRGTVFSDTDGDGIKDVGEDGIPEYTMHAIDASTGIIRTAATNSTGVYEFDNIAASPNTTLIQTGFFPSGHTVVDPASSWFRYVAPQTDSTVTFDVGFYPVPEDERVALEIRTYRDDSGNGREDSGEPGIEGLTFIAYTYTIGPEAYPVTNAIGRASVTDLVPADFAVLVNVEQLAESGYVWTATDYWRNDSTAGKQYDRTIPVADDPEPDSVHAMRLGLVPAL